MLLPIRITLPPLESGLVVKNCRAFPVVPSEIAPLRINGVVLPCVSVIVRTAPGALPRLTSPVSQRAFWAGANSKSPLIVMGLLTLFCGDRLLDCEPSKYEPLALKVPPLMVSVLPTAPSALALPMRRLPAFKAIPPVKLWGAAAGMVRVPAFTLRPPVKVLLPVRVSVCVPALVRAVGLPLSPITAEMVRPPLLY